MWSKLGWRPELFWRIYNGESRVDTIKIWGKNLVLQKGSVANKHQLCFVYFVYLKKISGSNCSPSQLEHKNYSISKQLQAHSSLFLHRRFYNRTQKLPPLIPSVEDPKWINKNLKFKVKLPEEPAPHHKKSFTRSVPKIKPLRWPKISVTNANRVASGLLDFILLALALLPVHSWTKRKLG